MKRRSNNQDTRDRLPIHYSFTNQWLSLCHVDPSRIATTLSLITSPIEKEGGSSHQIRGGQEKIHGETRIVTVIFIHLHSRTGSYGVKENACQNSMADTKVRRVRMIKDGEWKSAREAELKTTKNLALTISTRSPFLYILK